MQPGEVTDDTRQIWRWPMPMTRQGVLTAENVARELLAWEASNDNSVKLCMGPSTHQALEKVAAGIARPRPERWQDERRSHAGGRSGLDGCRASRKNAG